MEAARNASTWCASRGFFVYRCRIAVKIKMKILNPYRTTKIDEAAALLAAGAELVGLEPRSHRTIEFLLAPIDDCHTFSHQFARGDLFVSASRMSESFRALKIAVFARLKNQDDIPPRINNQP